MEKQNLSQSHLPNALNEFDSMFIRFFKLPELNTGLVFEHSNGSLDERSLIISYCEIEKKCCHQVINFEPRRILCILDAYL